MTASKFIRSFQDTKSFSFFQWLWAFSALIRFWDKRFHVPYRGVRRVWQVRILMRIRGQRPATIEEVIALTKIKPDLGHVIPLGAKFRRVPYLVWAHDEPKLTWAGDNQWNPTNRFLFVRKE